MSKREVAYSKDEDLMKIPLDQPVLVNIASQDDDAPVIDKKKEQEEEVNTRVNAGDQDVIDKLQKEVENLSQAEKLVTQQLAKERADRLAVQQTAQEMAEALARQSAQASNATLNNFKSALEAAQAEQEAAEAEYVRCLDSGDFAAAAKVQGKIGRAAAKVVTAERDLAQFDEEVKAAETRRPATEQRRAAATESDVLGWIDTNPNFLPSEREFLKSHPELILDNQKNAELGVAYNRAMSKGLSRGTPAYFEFVEDFLGYKTGNDREDEADEIDRVNRRAAAAPTRRDPGPSQQHGRPSQVRLTAEQRELIRSMGISEVEYAKNHIKLQNEKSSDPEKYSHRR